MWFQAAFQFIIVLLAIGRCTGAASPVRPFTTYKHWVELATNVADLWWTVDDAETEILFELHIKTTGWIALGISPGRQPLKFLVDIGASFSWWHERC